MSEQSERIQSEESYANALVEAPAGELPPPHEEMREEQAAQAAVEDEVLYCPQCGTKMCATTWLASTSSRSRLFIITCQS